MTKQLNILSPENNTGNVEYKWKLCNISKTKINKLENKMLYRLTEGNRYAEYYIGVCDNGDTSGIEQNELSITFFNLLECCKILNAKLLYYKIYSQYNNKYCMHMKFEIDNLPCNKISL